MEQQTVLITGASTGIGRACALDLSRRGFTVFATYRKEADAESLQAEASGALQPLYMDVTDAISIQAVVEQIQEVVGDDGLGGLVNNAGIVRPGPLEAIALEDLRVQLDVNVTGQLAVTQAFLPMIRKAQGRIVMMGSVGGINVLPFAGAYSASKFALEAISDALRMELKPWGIEVSVVQPGSIATPIWTKGSQGQLSPVGEALYLKQVERMRGAIRNIAHTGASPDIVAKVVYHALTARRPKTRYLVGRMAYVRALLQKLPDRLRDRILLRRLQNRYHRFSIEKLVDVFLRGFERSGDGTSTAHGLVEGLVVQARTHDDGHRHRMAED